MEGFLSVNKPQGMTSHDVVNRLRHLSGVRRIGHAGTLDPLATGVLLLGVGRATRLIEYLVGQSKRYAATVRLGQATNTYDADGEITAERPFSHLTLPLIEDALSAFRGAIEQRPPMYSAIKKDGQPLYKLARKGIELAIPARAVTIHNLQIREWQAPFLQLEIHCSSGTYIRSIAHDLGETLGCGGHITALRRTAVGDYPIVRAVPLDELTPEKLTDYLQPMETAVADFPRLDCSPSQAKRMLLGQAIERKEAFSLGQLAQTYDENGRFIGIAIAHEAGWRPKKMFHYP